MKKQKLYIDELAESQGVAFSMAVEQGFSVLGLDYSPIQGGHGNIEFLAYLKKEEGASNQVAPEIEKVVERAHREFKDE